MSKVPSSTGHSHRPTPYLPWKRITSSWAAGQRAPSLCRLFLSARTRMASCKLCLSMFAKQLILKPPIITSSHRAAAAAAVIPPPPPPPIRPNSPLCPPALQHRPLTYVQRSTSCTSRGSSMLGGAIAMANCLRRHSDAMAAPSWHSVPPTSYRLSLDDANGQEVSDMFAYMHRLGCSSTEQWYVQTAQQCSVGSPALARMKQTLASLRLLPGGGGGAASPARSFPPDLLNGNPFLTRLSPAPVSHPSTCNDHVAPSRGLLILPNQCRDAQLKDRLIFFL